MERSSFRARLFFIAGPAAAIVWSVYAAILTADARQRATESDQAYRQQARRVESAKRRFTRARHEALLAMRRGIAGADLAAAAALPVPASAPVAGMSAVNGAAVVNAGAVAEVAVPAAPASPAAAAPATLQSSIAIAKAAAAERAQLILALRESLDGIQVQVDEIRLGSAHELGDEWVRTVRIQLSGKKSLVKKAVALLRSAGPVRELTAGKLEPVNSPAGEMRTTMTGTLRSTNPQALVRG